jgi:hypothetical protein
MTPKKKQTMDINGVVSDILVDRLETTLTSSDDAKNKKTRSFSF